MIKSLRDGIEKNLALPVLKQAVAVELPGQLAQSEPPRYALSPDEQAVVREALERATQGSFAVEADVDAVLRRSWNQTQHTRCPT